MNIVVVGSINVDFVVRAERFPKKGETLMGEESLMSFGGKGANQAICASKLGAKVSMVGCIGADENGNLQLENFMRHGVDISHVRKDMHVSSGIAQITIAENDNTIIIVAGANQNVGKEDIDLALQTILQADIVMLQLEIPLDTVAYVIDICAKHNIKTILNPAPAMTLEQSLIDKITYLTPNEIEVEQIFHKKMEEVLPLYPNKMIVTAGSSGVYYHDGTSSCHIPAKKMTVVDTTGAGDAFNGALAYALCEDKPLQDAISFANRIAGLTIGCIGAQAAMPTKEELK